LDFEVFKRGYFLIGVIEASAAMFAFITFLLSHGWQYGQVDLGDPVFQSQAMTMTLLGAITSQLANAWTMRSWDFNIWALRWNSNKTLLFSMAAVLAWIWILVPFPIIILVFHESYKYFRLKKMDSVIL
jgi:sodium/potassium-transporting ATPase subunit alpha